MAVVGAVESGAGVVEARVVTGAEKRLLDIPYCICFSWTSRVVT